jgi:hypothetical protein
MSKMMSALGDAADNAGNMTRQRQMLDTRLSWTGLEGARRRIAFIYDAMSKLAARR